MTSLWGLRIGLRKYLKGYATSDSSLPFSSHHSTEHDSHQVLVSSESAVTV